MPFGSWWMLPAALVAVIAVCCLIGWVAGSLSGSFGRRGGGTDLTRQREQSSNWATLRDVADLRPRDPDPRRLRLCELSGKPLHSPVLRSKMVIAPSGAGKTPRVVVPDVLLHQGPAVVASVKGDVLALTRHARDQQGPVWVFDLSPAGIEQSARWSPLAHVQTWADALDAARWLQESSKVEGSSGGVQDREFWDAQALTLLAPLVFLAARTGRTIGYIGQLLTGGDGIEQDVSERLHQLGEIDPASDWQAFCHLEHRTKSSVLVTARNVLNAWRHPRVASAVNVAAGDTTNVLDLSFVTSGAGTLFLVAPASEQASFTPIYETLVNAVLMLVERAAQRRDGLPMDPPLLLMIDEAANIAPLRNLDAVASKSAGEGVLVVTVWQDEGQIEKIYGPAKARTIMANHYSKIYLPGIQDLATLDALSRQIGSDVVQHQSRSTDAGIDGRRSITVSEHETTVAPVGWLRQLPPDEAIVLTGRYRPIRGRIPGWYEDKTLRRLIPAGAAERYDSFFRPSRDRRRRPQLVAQPTSAEAVGPFRDTEAT